MMRKFTFLILLMTTGAAAMSQDKVPQPSTPVATARLIRFYPNPATTFINVELQRSTGRNYSFQLYNFLGKKVADLPDVSRISRIDLTNFGRGIYIYQVKDPSGKIVESGKFQVEK